jgi:hypothetical protein
MFVCISQFINHCHLEYLVHRSSHNFKYRLIHLYDNQIGDKGAEHLADALRNNTVILMFSSSITYTHLPFFTLTLTALYLQRNQIGNELQNHVEKLIERNKRMIKS